MKIGFDFDGTIIDHNDTKVIMCLKAGRKIALWEANSNIFEDAVGRDVYEEVSRSLYREETVNGKIFPDALDVMRFLKISGNEIFIVSARHLDSRGCAADWLKNNGLLSVVDIDRIHFCKESEKPAILEKLGIKLYVDDKLSVLQRLPPSVTKVLFDDQSLIAGGKIFLPDDISAVTDWNGIKKIVNKGREAFTLEEFKIACISDKELTDEQVDVLIKMTALKSEEEVVEFCAILHKYRPALENKFAEELKEKKSGAMTSPAFLFSHP